MLDKIEKQNKNVTWRSKRDLKKDSNEQISLTNKSNLKKIQKRNLMFTPDGNSNLNDNLKKFKVYNENTYASPLCTLARSLTCETNTSANFTEKYAGSPSDDCSFLISNIKVKHENNDSSKERDEIVIEHFEPEPLMFRDCRVASVRDFEALADRLYRASQARKSPERVYRVLYFLLREDKAIEKLKDAFKKKDGRSLETALTEYFGEGTSELQYALELLRKEDANADQAIQRRPSSKEEYMALSKRLHAALLQGDFETVYGALTPFQRNTESLFWFNEWYKSYKKDTLNIDLQADINGLQADIKQYLAGYPLKFGLFLIGDSIMETKVVSLSEANRLAKVALEQTLDLDGNGKRVRLPYECTNEGCLYRTHVIAEAFKELGYGVKKIMAHFLNIGEDDNPQGGLVNPDNTQISWDFHTACCIRVRTDSGIEIRIIDPSGDLNKPKHLWTVEEWIKRMVRDPSSCKFITFEEWQEEVKKYKQNTRTPYPIGLPYIFTTSRNHIDAPSASHIEEASQFKDIPDQYAHIKYDSYGKKFMIDATINQQVNFIICNKIKEKSISNDKDAQKFLHAITAKFEANKKEFNLKRGSNTLFWRFFPDTYDRFITHLQKKDVSSITVKCFEKYLYDDSEGLNKP